MEQQSTGESNVGKGWGCLVVSVILLLFGGWWVVENGKREHLETILSYISWPYRLSFILSIILAGILLTIQQRPEMIRIIKMIVIGCIGIISFMTIFKIGQDYIEFIPDGLLWVGHLDEAAAGVLFLKCLQYFEIDLTTLFDKE